MQKSITPSLTLLPVTPAERNGHQLQSPEINAADTTIDVSGIVSKNRHVRYNSCPPALNTSVNVPEETTVGRQVVRRVSQRGQAEQGYLHATKGCKGTQKVCFESDWGFDTLKVRGTLECDAAVLFRREFRAVVFSLCHLGDRGRGEGTMSD